MFRQDRIDNEVFDAPFNYHLSGRGDEVSIFEAAGPDSRSVEDFAEQQFRSAAMATALAWLEGKDFTFAALDVLVVGMVDADGDEEVGEDEEADYNELLSITADALIRLGASPENVGAFIDAEDDEAGTKLGKFLSDKLDAIELDDEDLITRFATSAGEPVFEATVKVIRGGKVVLKKKRVKKYRMTAAQRAGLKKARRKANTSAARRMRAKSMKIRKQRGM
ncbi:MAG: hypothetical protein ABIL58_23310 [Pseudomonadota bacterium]